MNNWKLDNIILFFTSIILLVVHFIISIYHFHETDSSAVFWLISKNSSENFEWIQDFIIRASPPFLSFFRNMLAIVNQHIPIPVIKNAINTSLGSTYPPLQGFFQGLYLPRDFNSFYIFGSLVNVSLLVSSCLMLYKIMRRMELSFGLSYVFSFGMICLYPINSYSYHLGSTIWFVFGICLGLYTIVFFEKEKNDIFLSISCLLSYPNILLTVSKIILDIYYLFKYPEYKKDNIFQSSYLALKKILKKYKYSVLTNLTIIIFFYPFGLTMKAYFDWKGLFTMFSILPLKENISFLTYLNSFLIYFLTLVTFLSIFLKNLNQEVFTKKKEIIETIFIYLILFGMMFLLRKISISQTRHSLFLIPLFLLLASLGCNIVLKSISQKFEKRVFSFFSIFIISLGFAIATKASFLRFDPLKTEVVPERIRLFASEYSNNFISLIGADHHYLMNDFSNKKANYKRIKHLEKLSIDTEGKRLIVGSRLSGSRKSKKIDFNIIKNGDNNLKKGDKLITEFKDVEITLLEDPFIIKKNIYFDSMNFDINSFNKEANPYARPNSIYIFPVEIKKLEKQ